MAETVTLHLPDALAKQAKQLATLRQQSLESILLEWLGRAVAELPLEMLSDEQVLAACDSQLEPQQQARLSTLLSANQEGELSQPETQELDELMQVYRQGLVRKAKAIKIAVERGLRSALSA